MIEGCPLAREAGWSVAPQFQSESEDLHPVCVRVCVYIYYVCVHVCDMICASECNNVHVKGREI